VFPVEDTEAVSGAAFAPRPRGRRKAAQRSSGALLTAAAVLSCACGTHLSRKALTSVAEVRQLSARQARLGIPARIRGIVTYADIVSSYCFVQDVTGGIRVALAPGQTPPDAGWRVDVTGPVSSGGNTPAVMEGRISPIRPEGWPPTLAFSASQLRDPQYQYRRVRLTGVVQSVSSERPGTVTLEVRVGSATLVATVPASSMVVNDEFTDSDVAVNGVLDETPVPGASGNSAALWVSDAGSIEHLHYAPKLVQLPVSAIRSLSALDPAHIPPHRVRVRGNLRELPPGNPVLADQTGQIAVHLEQTTPDPEARLSDLAGFLRWEQGRLVLDHIVPVAAVEGAALGLVPAPGSTITTARQVHTLPQAVAQRGYPVHLRAIVTFFDPFNHLLFVQDRTDGVYVGPDDAQPVKLRAGDEVELTGATTADFAPDVMKAHIRILGHAGLPAARPANLGNAAWGREDSRWIELGGIIQHVVQEKGDALVTLAWGRSLFKAHVLAPASSLVGLIDAEVKVRGVCGALFNGRRQMLGIQMFVPGAECIRVLRAPADPSSLSPTAIAQLMQFSGARDLGHRVRLRATVTYSSLTGPTWVRDSTGGIMVRDHDAQALAAGDLVEVTGFPEIEGFSPVLRGAHIKRLRSGAPPASRLITARDALKGEFDSQLVRIEGKLIDSLQQPAEQVLAVSSGDAVFTAHLSGGSRVDALEPGTQLLLTGICAVDTQQSQDLIAPRSFRLLLRSASDVEILSRPPWLTAGRVAPVLAGAALLIAAALAWVGLLRRRVRAQTSALRAQTIQLQAAHEKTRDALSKAREAEALDEDSNRILEGIARDAPVESIVDRIAESVASHCQGAACAILLDQPAGSRVCVVPAMPGAWVQALEGIRVRSVSFRGEFQRVRDFSADPAWAAFIDSQPARFRKCCAAPIVVDGTTVGAITAFFRDEKALSDPAASSLGLWCNMATLALERRRLHDELSHRAQHDDLTGLPNRALLYERLQREIERARRGGTLLGVLYIDLDGFKEINDTYGHNTGDAVLQETAKRMSRSVRRGDTVARIGGDEFVVLLPSLNRREDALQTAHKLKAALGDSIISQGLRVSVSACFGIGVWPLDGDQADAVLRFADAQMYVQKRRRAPHPVSEDLVSSPS